MVGDGGRVGVGDGEAAFGIHQITDERSVEDERLRTDFVAGHSFCEGGDFGGGETSVPYADFRDNSWEIIGWKITYGERRS